MKRNKLYLVIALCLAVGFALGLAVEGLFNKAHASTEKETPAVVKETPTTDHNVLDGKDFELLSSGSASRADYDIVYIQGRKYIIFSYGGDIEVLEF